MAEVNELRVSNRIKVFIMLIILIILTSQKVNGKVITINTTGGSDNASCCVDGECVCTSLYTALLNMTSNTAINVMSSVVLDDFIEIGPTIHNITISGNNFIVWCNKKGAIYCFGCSDVFIHGITWDKCVYNKSTVEAGFKCDSCSDIKFVRCTFQYSSIAVDFSEVGGNITFESCQFANNARFGLRIIYKDSIFYYGYRLVISGSTFDGNICTGSAFHLDTTSIDQASGISVLIEDTDFTSNTRAMELYLLTYAPHNIELTQVTVSGNSGGLDQSYTSGISLVSQSYIGTASVVVSSSLFENNVGIALSLSANANITLALFNSSFVNNTLIVNYYESSGIVFIKPGDRVQHVTVIFSSAHFSHNKYIGENGIVYILNPNTQYDYLFSNCSFQNNTSLSHGTAMFIDNSRAVGNNYNSSLMIVNSVFYKNTAEKSIIFVKGGSFMVHNLTLYSVQFVNNVGSCLYLPKCNLYLSGPILFSCNTADNGPALYCYHGTNIIITEGANVTFIENKALAYGGAIFVDVDPVLCHSGFSSLQDSTEVLFQGNIAEKAGDSIYFYNLDSCSNIINYTLICQFTYTQSSELSHLSCIGHANHTLDSAGTFPVMTSTKGCVCFHNSKIHCDEGQNEIKRGYWFGIVSGTPTTSPCPNRYCKFCHDSKAYCTLYSPFTLDAQCNNHRSGIACGDCSHGYTLAYDSTDCINVDHCNTGRTVLVVALTCLYWIVVVVGVFSAMYLSAKVSLGYFYGIIYFYSMVVVLLHDNPDMKDEVFHFVSVLSSFAQLSPQFLGEFCFVKGLSRIDQVFIHYFHAAAVSLIILGFVVAARCSRRITRFIGRCIIRVICLLLLLSYTSIASTSLPLLQPLKFADIGETYTYLSPHIKYFHGRHAFYGSVAAVCEVVIVIGFPLILLLEPFVNSKINFIKIKPLLDQFQNPYKNKYRWFAAYYLICRQAIVLTVYTSNDTALLFVNIAILIIHLWIQPYQTAFLNSVDNLILLFMVLVVVAPLLPSSVTAVTLVFILFPFVFICLYGIVKMIYWKLQKRQPYRQYVAIKIQDDDNDNNDGERDSRGAANRRDLKPVEKFGSSENQSYNTFQESFLEFAS